MIAEVGLLGIDKGSVALPGFRGERERGRGAEKDAVDMIVFRALEGRANFGDSGFFEDAIETVTFLAAAAHIRVADDQDGAIGRTKVDLRDELGDLCEASGVIVVGTSGVHVKVIDIDRGGRMVGMQSDTDTLETFGSKAVIGVGDRAKARGPRGVVAFKDRKAADKGEARGVSAAFHRCIRVIDKRVLDRGHQEVAVCEVFLQSRDIKLVQKR